MTEHAPDLSVTEARQGRRGSRAFVILMVSTALVVVAFVAIFALDAGPNTGKRGNREAPANVAQTVDQQPSTAKQTATTAPAGSVANQSAGAAGGSQTPAG